LYATCSPPFIETTVKPVTLVPVGVVTPAGNRSGGQTLVHVPVHATAFPFLVSVYSVRPCASTTIAPSFGFCAVITTAFTAGAAVPDGTVVADELDDVFAVDEPHAARPSVAVAKIATRAM
jgi:hypothetical protein